MCPRTGLSLPAVASRATLSPPIATGYVLTDAFTPFRTLQHRFEHWLFDWPETTGNRAIQLVATPLRYAYALLRDLFGGDLGLRAMGLVYSSLFALVPVVAVSFAVLKAFGYHRELEPVLAEFLRPLGEKGIELTVKFMQFVENAQTTVLGTVGFVILVYTVIVMIEKIEGALNFTWHVERPRSLARRVTEYMVIMIVGPVLMVAAMVLLTRIETSTVVAQVSGLAGTPGLRGHYAPYVLIIGLFWFLYSYMPNTRVRWQSAFIGALFGGAAWVRRLVPDGVENFGERDAAEVAARGDGIVFGRQHQSAVFQQRQFAVEHRRRYVHVVREIRHLPARSARGEALAEQVHRAERNAFAQRAGGRNLAVTGAQVLGVLHVEAQLSAEQHDQPAQVQPHHEQQHDRETGIDRRRLRRVYGDASEDRADADPRSPDPRSPPQADAAARVADEAMRASLAQTTLRDLLNKQTSPGGAANG